MTESVMLCFFVLKIHMDKPTYRFALLVDAVISASYNIIIQHIVG